MTPKFVKEMLPIFEAFANGREIQQLENNEWVKLPQDISDGFHCFARHGDAYKRYRIKPEEPKQKLYTLPLSETDALEITRDMWKWLSEDANRTKEEWIKQFQPQLLYKLRQDCACCQFAGLRSSGLYTNCNKCPLKNHWVDEEKQQNCDSKGQDYYIWSNRYDTAPRLAAALRISEAAAKRLAELQAEAQKPKQPTLRPWKPEEVPVGALIKYADTIAVIAYANKDYFGFTQLTQHTETGCSDTRSWNYKKVYDTIMHSLDHGKTWLPCGVME